MPVEVFLGFSANELLTLRRFLDDRGMTLAQLYEQIRFLERHVNVPKKPYAR